MDLKITRKQRAFIEAKEDEVLYGGAAGGGKSYGLVLEKLLYALRYPGSKQLILRRSYPELEKSIIRTALAVYPQSLFQYNSTKHTGVFANGSILDFGYCAAENDVYQYQGAEYDAIGFDELTHFTAGMYDYLRSRLRGVNSFPKQVKCTSNPGNVGHAWVKERFIDIGPPGVAHEAAHSSRIFIPALVYDNRFLMDDDPEYIGRLEDLPEDQRRALLDGDWDVFEGQYFTEFSRKLHVMEPFELPERWRRYVALDYGLDMLACYWIAVDDAGRAYVYRELYEGMDSGMKDGHIVSGAAARILEMTEEPIYAYLAPPDLWNRQKDTGRSIAEGFSAAGIYLTRAQNDRVQGWLDLKEWLHPGLDELGSEVPALRIFSTCRNLIRCLPMIQHDERNPNDCAKEPHELTHAPDAIRYFVAGRPRPALRRMKQKNVLPPELREDRPKGNGVMDW